MKKVQLCCLVVAGMLWFGGSACAETLYLSVAASMTDAFKEIAASFSVANPGDRLQPNFASSGSLAKQIEQGAPADVYVSANPKWMKYLAEKGLVDSGTVRVFAYNTLVFSGIDGKVESLEDLIGLDRVAIGTPQSVPAGQYARQAMENAGVYAELERSRKLVMAKDVRQALLYADRGEVDGAFVYKTDALLARNARIIFAVPDHLHERVAYPIGITGQGSGKQLARDFCNHMKSQEAIVILKKYGFEPALPIEASGEGGESQQ